jgi:ABC-type amino acid transport substrate-binding protein
MIEITADENKMEQIFIYILSNSIEFCPNGSTVTITKVNSHNRKNFCSIEIVDDGVSIFSLASAPVEDLAALNGQAVGIVSGSAGEVALPSVSQAAGVAVSSVRYPDFTAAVSGLLQGAVRAILSERRPALDVHFREVGYFVTDQRYIARPISYVIQEGDSDFRDLLNLTLGSLQTNGTYNELYGLWFDDTTPTLDVPPGQPAIPLVISTAP